MVEGHARIKKSGLPNLRELRIPVKSQLRIPVWRKYLHGYWDQQLLDLIEFGFPLDFDRTITLNSTEANHYSALQYPDHIENYLTDEIKNGATYGKYAFSCHISPFFTRDKPNSKNRRVILDLGFPPQEIL